MQVSILRDHIDYWMVTGQWLGALGTILAVVVALCTPLLQNVSKAKVRVDKITVITKNFEDMKDYIQISIVNLKNIPITIKDSGVSLPDGRKLVFFEGIQLDPLPKKLHKGDGYEYPIIISKFYEQMEKISIGKNEQLEFYFRDSLGKKYSTKLRLKDVDKMLHLDERKGEVK